MNKAIDAMTGIPKPPKRPLTPYMRFSKASWPEMKVKNPTMTVCEIGSSIGKMWRGLTPEEKQVYNDGFLADKKEYEVVLQTYLKEYNLTVSDIYKKRKKNGDKKSASQTTKESVRNAIANIKNEADSSAKQQRMNNYNKYENGSNQGHVQNQRQAYQMGNVGLNGMPMTQQNVPIIIHGYPNNPNQAFVNGQQMMYIPQNGTGQQWNEPLPTFHQMWPNTTNGEGQSQGQTQSQVNNTPGMIAINGAPQNFMIPQGFVNQRGPAPTEQGNNSQGMYVQSTTQSTTNGKVDGNSTGKIVNGSSPRYHNNVQYQNLHAQMVSNHNNSQILQAQQAQQANYNWNNSVSAQAQNMQRGDVKSSTTQESNGGPSQVMVMPSMVPMNNGYTYQTPQTNGWNPNIGNTDSNSQNTNMNNNGTNGNARKDY